MLDQCLYIEVRYEYDVFRIVNSVYYGANPSSRPGCWCFIGDILLPLIEAVGRLLRIRLYVLFKVAVQLAEQLMLHNPIQRYKPFFWNHVIQFSSDALWHSP